MTSPQHPAASPYVAGREPSAAGPRHVNGLAPHSPVPHSPAPPPGVRTLFDLRSEFAALAAEPHPFVLWRRVEQLVDRFEEQGRVPALGWRWQPAGPGGFEPGPALSGELAVGDLDGAVPSEPAAAGHSPGLAGELPLVDEESPASPAPAPPVQPRPDERARPLSGSLPVPAPAHQPPHLSSPGAVAPVPPEFGRAPAGPPRRPQEPPMSPQRGMPVAPMPPRQPVPHPPGPPPSPPRGVPQAGRQQPLRRAPAPRPPETTQPSQGVRHPTEEPTVPDRPPRPPKPEGRSDGGFGPMGSGNWNATSSRLSYPNRSTTGWTSQDVVEHDWRNVPELHSGSSRRPGESNELTPQFLIEDEMYADSGESMLVAPPVLGEGPSGFQGF